LSRRRAAEDGFKQKLGYHVVPATGITAFLEAGGTVVSLAARDRVKRFQLLPLAW
jgi:hypothetical protein